MTHVPAMPLNAILEAMRATPLGSRKAEWPSPVSDTNITSPVSDTNINQRPPAGRRVSALLSLLRRAFVSSAPL